MKKKIVYLALDEDEIKFASESKSEVNNYIENQAYEARARAMEELGIDDDETEEQLQRAELYASMEGYFLDKTKVNITGLDEDDEVELDNGTEIRVGDILDKLDEDEDDDYDEEFEDDGEK